METWAKDWLEEQRKAGKKGFEIKVRGDCHYIYSSTSSYDKKSKKVAKSGKYGSLSFPMDKMIFNSRPSWFL